MVLKLVPVLSGRVAVSFDGLGLQLDSSEPVHLRE
jgi:hypothetical protein